MTNIMSPSQIIQWIAQFDHFILPIMFGCFAVAVAMKLALYAMIRREYHFVEEFEKHTKAYLAAPENQGGPKRTFYNLLKDVLTITYEDLFIKRAKFKRRASDPLMIAGDRLFLHQSGVNVLIKDTLAHTKSMKREAAAPVAMDHLVHVSKRLFESNPMFNKLFGILPVHRLNETLSALPGIFVISGIFGTFLGIMLSLPTLGGMDISNVGETNKVMAQFLQNMSFSMTTSISGIALYVAMTLVNLFFSADFHYYRMVNMFSSALELIWNDTSAVAEVPRAEELVKENTVTMVPVPPMAANVVPFTVDQIHQDRDEKKTG